MGRPVVGYSRWLFSSDGVGLRNNRKEAEVTAVRESRREWSVLYPNGVRVRCESCADALSVMDISGGQAQWRTPWLDVDVTAVAYEVAEREPFDPRSFDESVRGVGRDSGE